MHLELMQIRAHFSGRNMLFHPSLVPSPLSSAVGGPGLRRGESARDVCGLKDGVKRDRNWRLGAGWAQQQPHKEQDAQLINLKFEHLDEIKDLAAEFEHLGYNKGLS